MNKELRIKNKIEDLIKSTLQTLRVKEFKVSLEHPAGPSHGDYATNVAMVYAKDLKVNPKELAEKIKAELEKNLPEEIERVEVAGPGFINFYLSKKFFTESIKTILKEKDKFGRNKKLKGQKVIIEYTDPNPFKEFHIGHLMSNAVGETLSRIIEWSGAKVKRANYQGDVGIHVAKSIWWMQKQNLKPDNIATTVLGRMYMMGAKMYEEDEQARKEIEEINKKIYDRSDLEINKLYDSGKDVSLKHFKEIYNKLSTEFDYNFFESEGGVVGKKIVEEFLEKGVFEESEGAVIFKGEKYGLHTRVFINSQGLPTYEAKELGLAKIKYGKYKYDVSIIVTGNEIDEYFKVLLKAMEFVFPDLAKKTKHISHGMLRLPTGKMASRKGDVITGESLIEDVEKLALKKIKSSGREFSPEEEKKIAEMIAVGAIKYSILKQSPERDIIFDFEKSLSFEGDSGPYLQYSYTRAFSVLEKAKSEGIKSETKNPLKEITDLEHLLYRFPEVVERALNEYESQHIVTYLIELAQNFNTFYAKIPIVEESKESPYKVALTEAFATVIKNGLYLLGIKTPEKM